MPTPQPADAARWIAALESYIDEHVDAFGAAPDLFPAEQNRAFADKTAAPPLRASARCWSSAGGRD